MTWLERMGLVALLCISAAFYAASLDWGLPSRANDSILFAGVEPWTGAALSMYDPPPSVEGLAADVDADPLDRSAGPIVLNGTPADTAEILRRYRLFTCQPDEMITFKALARMKPATRDFDPKLYQYGGLWIYPVGGLLKAAALFGWVKLTPEKPYYYDDPEAFGRLYVVARAYACCWAVVGTAVASALGRRLSGSAAAGLATGALFVCLPVVYSTAHEAKPHLPGAVLTMAACLAAARYTVSGRRLAALAAGVLCGAAAGMIISGVLSFVLLPAMVLLAPGGRTKRGVSLLLAVLAGVGAYAATNPYVVRGLLMNPSTLRANLGNSTAMYAPAGRMAGVANALNLLSEAASPVVLVAGAAALLVAIIAARTRERSSARATAWLLTTAAMPVLVQFVILASGKSAEYGRFAVLPAAALAAGAVALVRLFRPVGLRGVIYVALPLVVGLIYVRPYARAFLADCGTRNTRTRAAAFIAGLDLPPAAVIQIDHEPAPYDMPPIGLWRTTLLLAVPGELTGADLIVRAVDRPTPETELPEGYRRTLFDDGVPAPISWANKPIEVFVRDPQP